MNDEDRHLMRERVELDDHRFIGDLFFKWKDWVLRAWWILGLGCGF